MSSAPPFQSMDGRKPLSLFPRVTLESIGGEQVLLCRVRYEPGAEVPRHSHEHTEQLMYMLEGELDMTVRSERGCAFFEALAPVPLDHVADRDRDLVLGPDGGRRHVER